MNLRFRPARSLRCAGAALCLVVAVTGCQTDVDSAPVRGATPTSMATSTMKPRLPYIDLVDTVAAAGGRVWVEVDLVKAWQDSPQRYADVLNIAISLARHKGVDGIKIADELGYHDGLDSPAQVRDFLTTSANQIHERLPRTKVLVDMVVPELGCVAWAAQVQERDDCATTAGNNSPAATIDAVDSYLALKAIDVLDLSVGMREESQYQSWGITRDSAMRTIWQEVDRRKWASLVHLQARKALAHTGPYTGGAGQAAQDLRTFVDIPVSHGAAAVDIWTWSQQYEGETFRLTDPGLKPNALTQALLARRKNGVQLWTHMTPSSMEIGQEQDVRAALKIFTGVFVAAGTG